LRGFVPARQSGAHEQRKPSLTPFIDEGRPLDPRRTRRHVSKKRRVRVRNATRITKGVARSRAIDAYSAMQRYFYSRADGSYAGTHERPNRAQAWPFSQALWATLEIATLPGMAERTVTISGLSKTFSITGWRLGYCIAPAAVTPGIRKVHDFLTVGAAAPLQQAGVYALGQPDAYYRHLSEEYAARRDHILQSLQSAGFKCYVPRGAYYVMTDISTFGFNSDTEFVRHLITEVGIAAVPGSSFYAQKSGGSQQVRFCFCKKYETLKSAQIQLLKLK
jgi:hypothetical protein